MARRPTSGWGGSRAGILGSGASTRTAARWTVAFEAHDGDILTAGTTYTATSREGGAPYIDVAGMGRGCGYGGAGPSPSTRSISTRTTCGG